MLGPESVRTNAASHDLWRSWDLSPSATSGRLRCSPRNSLTAKHERRPAEHSVGRRSCLPRRLTLTPAMTIITRSGRAGVKSVSCGLRPAKNAAQMLRGFRPTGEKANRSQAPPGRSWRNLCVRELAKELRIATGWVATQVALCDLPESGGCNRGDSLCGTYLD